MSVHVNRSNRKGNPDLLRDEIIQFIHDHKSCIHVCDICDGLCFCRETFNSYFPADCENYKMIMEELNKNIIKTKAIIRDRLLDMNNPTALIALYKLIGTKDERDALSNFRTNGTEEKKEITLKIGK